MGAGKYASKKQKEKFIKVFSYIFPAAAAVIAALFITLTSLGGVSFEVFADGKAVGYVGDIAEYEKVKSKLEKDMSDILEVSYKYSPKEELKPRYGAIHKMLTEDELYDRLYKACGREIAEAYALEIDGTLVAANAEKTVINTALKRVCSIMSKKYGCEVEIANSVSIIKRPVSSRLLMDESAIVTTLCGKDALIEGDVGSATTATEIANVKKILGKRIYVNQTDATLENTYYIPADFSDDITASLVYKSTVIENYTEKIPYKTIYEKSKKYYDGMTYVSVEGVLGERNVTAKVSYINGEEVSREVIAYKNISEPVDKIVLEGTKKKPPTAPTGTFILPLENTSLNCAYGWRNIFGSNSFHYGLDLRADLGTTVYASDGGVVVAADMSGTYGYMVKISHGDKYESLYAHLSSILVEVGDEVYQGQPIALSGESGRTTGPHLHYEIYEFGERKNPALFLKNVKPSSILKLSQEKMKKLLSDSDYFTK